MWSGKEETREDGIAWAQSLKPGDKVFLADKYRKDKLERVLMVKKVTPSGIVRTKEGMDFKQDTHFFSESFDVCGYGKTRGRIVPYTEERAKQYEAQRRRTEQEQEEMQLIMTAQSICRSFCENRRWMAVETARKIIEIAEETDCDIGGGT